MRYRRGCLFLLIGMLLVGVIFWHGPYQVQQQELAAQRAALQQKKMAVLGIENFLNAHTDIAAYEAEKLQAVEQQSHRLPQQMETGEFLAAVQKLSVEKGMMLLAASPGTVEKRTGYLQLPVQMTIRGSYFSVLDFLQGIENLERFSSIEDMAVHSEEGMLTCQFCVCIYAREKN